MKFYLFLTSSVSDEALRCGLRKVCVLATPTTIKFDLYGKSLSKKGIEVVYPPNGMQELHELIIRNMVTGKKTLGDIRKLEISIKRFILEHNLDGIILGCTELPLVFPKKRFENVVDCMEVLADKLLENYYN